MAEPRAGELGNLGSSHTEISLQPEAALTTDEIHERASLNDVAVGNSNENSQCFIKFIACVVSFLFAITLGFLTFCHRMGVPVTYQSVAVFASALVDGLYFIVVTLTSVGYGDIVPNTKLTMVLASILMLYGFGILSYVMLRTFIGYIYNRLKVVSGGVLDENETTMKTRKAILASLMSFLCILSGTLGIHYIEHVGWIHSVYFAVTSLTTVGYGDYTFKTTRGRIFATCWLLANTYLFSKTVHCICEHLIDRIVATTNEGGSNPKKELEMLIQEINTIKAKRDEAIEEKENAVKEAREWQYLFAFNNKRVKDENKKMKFTTGDAIAKKEKALQKVRAISEENAKLIKQVKDLEAEILSIRSQGAHELPLSRQPLTSSPFQATAMSSPNLLGLQCSSSVASTPNLLGLQRSSSVPSIRCWCSL